MEKGNLTLIYNNLQRFKCFLTNLQNISLDLSKTFKNNTIVTFFTHKINFFHPITYIFILLYRDIIVSANLIEPSVDLYRDLSSPFTKLRKRYYKERKIEPVTFSKENVKRRKFLARASTED